MDEPDLFKTTAVNPTRHSLRASASSKPVPGRIRPYRRVPLEIFGLVVIFAALALFALPNGGVSTVTRSVPWKGGERLHYKVSWANFVAAGELSLECQEVSEPGKSKLYRLAVKARSVDWVRTLFLNVNDVYESSVDAGTLLPIQAEARLEHGNKLEQSSIRFDHRGRVARLSNGQTRPLAPNTYDAATLMFILRTLELDAGKTQIVQLLDKQTVYALRAEVEQTESVRVGQKDYQAARLAIKQIENGAPQDTLKIRLYLTLDSRRVPVLMTAEPAWGTIRVELQ